MSIPTSEHPRDAYSEEKCAVNQEGPVWFLADQLGGREERTCTIPAGKAILIPLLTGECDYGIPEVKNFFVFLEPLLPGQHKADLKVSVLNRVETSYNYNADWTYNLVTEPSNNSTGQ
jgi:hypothetical protein